MRWFTTMLVVALCAWAAARGCEIVQFAKARSEVVGGQIAPDALRRWMESPGLTNAALQAALRQPPAVGDHDARSQRAEDLMALLTVQPLSSTDWLSLAGMRLVTAQPYE